MQEETQEHRRVHIRRYVWIWNTGGDTENIERSWHIVGGIGGFI